MLSIQIKMHEQYPGAGSEYENTLAGLEHCPRGMSVVMAGGCLVRDFYCPVSCPVHWSSWWKNDGKNICYQDFFFPGETFETFFLAS